MNFVADPEFVVPASSTDELGKALEKVVLSCHNKRVMTLIRTICRVARESFSLEYGSLHKYNTV